MNAGVVEIELYGTQSPLNVANFLSYIDNGAYNDSIIHRTRDGATVAGSELFAQGGSFKEDGTGIVPGPAVNNEFNAGNGLSNTQYTLAAARSTALNSATSGWFINATNNTAFDNPASPYTVLGKVTKGTSVIDQLPLMPNLPILKGSSLESMPIFNNGEVIINRAARIPLVAGDYNISGSVTSADYTTWRASFGFNPGALNSIANAAPDGNGNGFVDASDYVTWRKGLGSGTGSGFDTTGVPEPSATLLIFSNTFLLSTCRRRRS
jgi:peptidyl-prolyl cis-trans isomerase A (cyclophilin A)